MREKAFKPHHRITDILSAVTAFLKVYFSYMAFSLIILSTYAFGSNNHFCLRGIFELNKQLYFSVESRFTGNNQWIAADKEFEGLTLEQYDQTKQEALGTFDQKPIKLRLFLNDNHLAYDPLTISDSKKLERAIETYKKNQYQNLPNQNSALYLPMKQAADNRIGELQMLPNQSTNSLRTETSTAIEVSSLENPSQVINKPKLRNRVNSRIWASDHIETHGLPTIP